MSIKTFGQFFRVAGLVLWTPFVHPATHKIRYLLMGVSLFVCVCCSLFLELDKARPPLSTFSEASLMAKAIFVVAGVDIGGFAIVPVSILNLILALWLYFIEPVRTGIVRFVRVAWTQASFFLLLTAIYGSLYVVGNWGTQQLKMPMLEGPILGPLLSILPYSLLTTVFFTVLRLIITAYAEPGGTSQRDWVKRGNEVIRDDGQAVFRANIDPGSGIGLALHPEVRIPLAQERRHILVVGAPGSGKTQAMFPWVQDVVQRRWPALIYDFKGDYTEAFGEAEFAAILSPFDARGAAWDIAFDIDTPIRASEFAVQLMPHHTAREPFFPKAAQDLLTGVLVKLQAEKALIWTFADLVEILSDRDRVLDACKSYRPAALNALGDPQGRQAASVFGELRTSTIQLEYLASAWSAAPRKISVRSWVAGEGRDGPQVIILKGSQQYRELDGFFTALIFNLLAKNALSLADSYERQIWAFLDEFGNLPKIDGFDRLLTAVRSKGLRVVAAIQDIAQIEEAYSRPFTQTFFGAFGTVLAGIASGDTAAYLSRTFGQNQVGRLVSSQTHSSDMFQPSSSTTSETVVVENALLDSEFSSLPPPGPGQPAVFWVKTAGWPIAALLYTTRPTPKLYPADLPNDRLLSAGRGPLVITKSQSREGGELPRFQARELQRNLITNEGESHGYETPDQH